MDAQRQLIGLARDRGGFKTYAALAARVGVTTATMSQWRSGAVPLSEERLEEFAEIAGENAGFWDIAIRSERAKSASLRRQLQAILKAGISLTLALAWIPTALGGVPNFPTNGSEATPATVGIMRNVRRILRQLHAAAGRLTRRRGAAYASPVLA